MCKKKIVAASVLAPFALAAVFLSLHTAPSISPSQVFTWDCEIPVQEPVAITLTCADGGMYIDSIDWSRWDVSGAQGSGVYKVNECDPSCAERAFLQVSVSLVFTKLQEFKSKHYLRMLVIQTNDGKNLPMFGTDTKEWDVLEFKETMGGLH